MMIRRAGISLFLTLVWPMLALAGTTGKISGSVKDKESGQTLQRLQSH